MSDAELDAWLYGPGVPASAQHAKSQRLVALDATTAAWLKGTLPTAKLDTKHWTALEWMKFLNDIDNKADSAQLKALDAAFGLAKTGNNEVAFRFYRAAVHAGYREIRPQLQAFLMSVGRQKFVVPLYVALRANAEDRAFAEAVYKSARERYHPETQGSVDKAMKK
jgi:leukotriene-A4 hydrolase